MNSRLRPIIALTVFAFIALTCLVYWPLIAAEILAPVALLVWLLLRIFILSVAQQFYWYGILFVALFAMFRLWPQNASPPTFEKQVEMNVAIRRVKHWRSLFTLTNHDLDAIRHIKWELVRLLLSLYATKQHTDADLRLHEALRHREISLPDDVYAFLFPKEEPERKCSFLQRAKYFWLVPLRWAQRQPLQQREIAECRRQINAVLGFIEKSLEMNDGDDGGRRKQNQY